MTATDSTKPRGRTYDQPLRITLSHTRTYGGGEEGKHVELRIEDVASSLTLAEIRLDAAQFTDLMGSSSITVEGFVPKGQILGRIGRELINDSVTLDREIQTEADAERTAWEIMPAPFNETADVEVRVRKNNTGHWVVYYRCWAPRP